MRLRRFGKHRETKIADQSKAMGWQDLTHSDENAKYHYRFARFVSDDTGQELGLVMQFYEGGPAYALLEDCRLGPHDTFEEAQAAVRIRRRPNPRPISRQANLTTPRALAERAVRPRQVSRAARGYSRRQLL